MGLHDGGQGRRTVWGRGEGWPGLQQTAATATTTTTTTRGSCRTVVERKKTGATDRHRESRGG